MNKYKILMLMSAAPQVSKTSAASVQNLFKMRSYARFIFHSVKKCNLFFSCALKKTLISCIWMGHMWDYWSLQRLEIYINTSWTLTVTFLIKWTIKVQLSLTITYTFIHSTWNLVFSGRSGKKSSLKYV